MNFNSRDAEIVNVTCFAGGQDGIHPQFLRAAQEIGEMLANEGFGLVYGGGKYGLMGALARSYLGAGGKRLTSVLMREYEWKGRVLESCHSVIREQSIGDRKKTLIDLSEAIVVLPGGIGTSDEIFSSLAIMQLTEFRRLLLLCSFEGFYDSLVGYLKGLVDHKFCRAEDFGSMRLCKNSLDVLNGLRELEPPLKTNLGSTT